MSRLCTIEDTLYISVSGAVWASHIWISRHCACRSRAASLPFVLLMWPDSCNKTTATCQLYNKEAFNAWPLSFPHVKWTTSCFFFFFFFKHTMLQLSVRCWEKQVAHLKLILSLFPPVLLLTCPHNDIQSNHQYFLWRPLYTIPNTTSQHFLYHCQAKFSVSISILLKINTLNISYVMHESSWTVTWSFKGLMLCKSILFSNNVSVTCPPNYSDENSNIPSSKKSHNRLKSEHLTCSMLLFMDTG